MSVVYKIIYILTYFRVASNESARVQRLRPCSLAFFTIQLMAAQQVQSAITALDSIFNASPSTAPALQTTTKRARKDADVSTSALMALLPPSRKRQRLVRLASSGHSIAEDTNTHKTAHARGYVPNSLDALMDRISTYTLTLWSDQQPEGCSAVEFARYGWRCRRSVVKGRPQVHCEACEGAWDVQQIQQWRTGEGQAAADALRRDIREKHAKLCPWRNRPTPREPGHVGLLIPLVLKLLCFSN